MPILVRATQRGYYGSLIREPGDEFEYEGYQARWLEPVDGGWPEGSEKPEPVIDPTSNLGLRNVADALAAAAVGEVARQAKAQAATGARSTGLGASNISATHVADASAKAKPAKAPDPAKAAAKAERAALVERGVALGVPRPNFMSTVALTAASAEAEAKS
jgi:hypothetical protein